ncbi:DUF4391 domain-containing protein [Dehalococcoides mccartyi]|uniref:DUF4391 domain-containing protein n=1 Tax=Dehalococcoides mccartyi TaxID=61435 RepID=UPI0002B7679B|nr:DUF4391 domain-containing protein [Dehalococcoides mccartyi]AGG05704.1 hypothetical protein dcmb_71 [Dehalococcoides mccartyi DCMB5]AGG07270.1 hypothetical protein btf_161 [Dehalococcoides mccartyi BTF08]AOV98756.1 methyl-accepting chemotaxis protein [Dehalococcoides mccartyi]AQU05424.1 hypothetical protein B1777_01570 [Dehalococcoides mccartyi]POZ59253.1 Methyl-accepting chemotaxis protein [Dehalococcoides mccartyi]
MRFVKILDALSIPPDARVDQRVPKKLLLEQDIPTPADKRQIQDGIEELLWVAALKPTNIGVPSYRDNIREYLEIAVVTVTLRQTAKVPRITELVHRTIPYPVVLISNHDDAISLSLAHKRQSQGEIGKVVIEDIRQTRPFHPESPTEVELSFLTGLKISSLPRTNLFTLYQGWLDCIAWLEAAQITGNITSLNSGKRSKDLWNTLDEYTRLSRDITTLRAQAEKEKQLNRRVELNLKIKKLEAELADTRKTL